MKNKNLIIIGIIIVGYLYLVQPVPYCKEVDYQQPSSPQTTVTTSDVNSLQQDIDEKNYLVFHTVGESMYPDIKTNSNCLCLQKSHYDVGDIVVFFQKLNGDYEGIAHQIVLNDGENIITKGTNNEFSDTPIKEENILCYIPKTGRLNIK